MQSTGLSALLWFMAIVVMIPVALWLFKRSSMGVRAGRGLMAHVASLPLSTSQRLVTVEVGSGDQRRWLVLGVTPHSITTLYTMEPQEEAPSPENSPALPFAQLLGKLRRDQGASGG